MIKNLKKRILSAVKSKRINVFLLFVGLSFVTLLILKLSSNYTKTIAFNVAKQHIPEAYVIVNDSNHVLNITLKTSGFNLLKYYMSKPSVAIDFKNNIIKTDSLFIWSKSAFFSKITEQFDKDVELMNMTPDTLKFQFDKHEVKSVPIKLNASISFSPGYDLFKPVTLTPDSLRIIGPRTLVEAIKVIETDSVKLTQIKSNQQIKAALKLPENTEKNLIFSNNKTTVTIEVDKFTEGHLNIPVNIINVPENITLKYFPKRVSVSYYTSLTNFNKVKPKDFLVVCDYSQVGEKQAFLKPKITKLSEYVRHAKVDQKQIEFIIVE